MVGVLILTHGGLASELLEAARVISGKLDSFEALPLDWQDGFDEAYGKVEAAIERLDRGAGVLILTDIFGGTPSNVAMALQKPGRVEMVSGVNLPMVVRLGCQYDQQMELAEMTTWLRNKGRASIRCSSELRAEGRRARGKK